MTTIKLKIAELRKKKGVGQQELADALGVSFQTVSKWETGVTMPDIALLPKIGEYFGNSVDEILGLKPLEGQEYVPRNTDNRDTWNNKRDKMHVSRKYVWNDDYFEFLVDKVWKLNKPVNVIDFRCGDGYLGMKFFNLLPEGSTYTGIDNDFYIEEARKSCENSKNVNYIASDIYSIDLNKKYDVAIMQIGLRHMNKPLEVLAKMKDCVKKDGLVICVEINREFENAGFYFDGLNYDYLCTAFDFHKLWRKELAHEGRDYAIGMRLPFYMEKLGLSDIDVRMNDKIVYVSPQMKDYEKLVTDFAFINGWDKDYSDFYKESTIELFMNRGSDRYEAESYIKMQSKIRKYFSDGDSEKSFLKVHGLIISFGRV